MTDANQTPDLSPLAQELIQNEAPDNALVALLNELEETAAELRDELAVRHATNQTLLSDDTDADTDHHARYKKVNPNVTPEQEEELENFPEYWANAKGSWSSLFKLLREFRVEMRKGHNDANDA